MASAEVQLRNAESSILFMQQDHAKTLQGLHTEIQKLQKKCSELTFELAMKTTTTVDEDYYMKKIKSLEANLNVKSTKTIELEKEVEKRDKRLNLLEQQLRAQDKKYRDELKLKSQKMNSLNSELDNRSATIAYLTASLHKEKQKHKNRNEQTVELLEKGDKRNPIPPKDPARNSARRRSQLRRSATSPVQYDLSLETFQTSPPSAVNSVSEGRVGSGGRRPQIRPASPVVGDLPDPSPFLIAREPSDEEVRLEVKPCPPVLPPIRDPKDELESKHTVFTRRGYRFAKKKDNTGAAVNTLAVDQIASSEPEYRKLEKSPTDCN
ncbi:coiled-coil domain-containing protein 92-like [Glandiceps talaboti]